MSPTTLLKTAEAPLRRSLRLWQALDAARLDGSTVVLDGAGVNDILVGTDGALRRIHPFLAFWAAQHGMATLAYSLAGAVRVLPAADGSPRTPLPSGIDDGTPATVALDILFSHARRSAAPLTIVIDFVEGLLSADGGSVGGTDAARILEQLAAPSADTSWADQGHSLILIGRTGSSSARLTSLPGITVVPVGLPDLPERTIVVDRMINSPRHRLHLADDLDPPRAARITGGLPVDDISRMRLRSSDATPVSVSTVIREKSIALRRLAGDTLQLHDEILDLEADVAGIPQVRLLVREVLAGGGVTVRAIFAGPPGCGKTRCCTAIAGGLGVPAVSLAQIRAPYIGQAEDNLNRALAAIEAMAPALLILDECDETGMGKRGSGGGGEGSEVTANLRARLFGWLGDNGDQLGISVIGTTNYPNRLDPAATDRFSIVPVLQPSAADLVQIMAIQARRENIGFDSDGAAAALHGRDLAMSGREAVRLVARAKLRAVGDHRRMITGGDVMVLLSQQLSPGSTQEEYQSLLAVAATTWTSHLPWIAAAELGVTPDIPHHLRDFVTADGQVDLGAVHTRLRILEHGGSS